MVFTFNRAPGAIFALAFAALIAAPAARGKDTARTFDIPAGYAEETLRLFAGQAGTEFVFSAGKVKGVRTNAVKGEYPPHEALDRLLSGTALHAVQDAPTGALTVDRDPPASAQGTATKKKSTRCPLNQERSLPG